MHCPKNGLTASGNVADSHCIPILALKPHSLREPNARAKVVFILQQSKQSHNKLHILEAHFTPHGKQRVSLLENCGFLVGKLEFSNRETHAPILSVKPVVKFLVTIERQVFLEASATQGIEHHFLLCRRKSNNTPTPIEIASTTEVHDEFRHELLILFWEQVLLELREPLGIPCGNSIAIKFALPFLGAMTRIYHVEILFVLRHLRISHLAEAFVCHKAVSMKANGKVFWQSGVCFLWHSVKDLQTKIRKFLDRHKE